MNEYTLRKPKRQWIGSRILRRRGKSAVHKPQFDFTQQKTQSIKTSEDDRKYWADIYQDYLKKRRKV